jgi:hypothetical protein
MRLPLISPADLSPKQRPLYADMRAGIEKNFRGFEVIAEPGALIGPWRTRVCTIAKVSRTRGEFCQEICDASAHPRTRLLKPL